MATFISKPKEFQAYTFPKTIFVQLEENEEPAVKVDEGDYLLFSDQGLTTMTKRELLAVADPKTESDGEEPPRVSKPRERKPRQALGENPAGDKLPNGKGAEVEQQEAME